MIQTNFTVQNDPIYPIGESYLTSSRNILTCKVSQLANFVFSAVYAVYDFPRYTNPVTQQREFRWIPTFVENAIGRVIYPIELRRSGRLIQETSTEFGNYSKLIHKIGKELIAKCPRKDLSFEFEVVNNNKENSWCLPGGKIAINLGLIRNMEKELNTFGMDRSFTLEEKIAAVLSHEITHAAARHSARTIEFRCLLFCSFRMLEIAVNVFLYEYFKNKTQQLKKRETTIEIIPREIAKLQKGYNFISNIIFIFFNFIAYQWILNNYISRSHEFEADKYGMHLIHKVGSENNTIGFNKTSAESAVWLQHYFKDGYREVTGWLGWIMKLFSTHPSSEARLAANKITWQELSNSA